MEKLAEILERVVEELGKIRVALERPARVSAPASGEGPKSEWPEAFDTHFWPIYPRKVAKVAARRAWMGLLPKNPDQEMLESLLGRIMDSLEADVAKEWASRDPEKIPHAATWLTQRRFEDHA